MKGGYYNNNNQNNNNQNNNQNDESLEENSDIEHITSSTAQTDSTRTNSSQTNSSRTNSSQTNSSSITSSSEALNIKNLMKKKPNQKNQKTNQKSNQKPNQMNLQYIYTDPKSDVNNGWSEQLELDAKHIGEMCSGLRWMHNQSAGYFQTRYWFIVILDAILACIVVTFNSITGASCIDDSWNPFRVISLVGTAILGLVSTYGGVKNYGGRVTAHQFAEGNYQTLFHTIRNQLHKANRRERQYGYDFLEWIQKEYNDLSANPDAPDIPDYIVKEYEKRIEGRTIAKYNDIEDITVVDHVVYDVNSEPLLVSNNKQSNNKQSNNASIPNRSNHRFNEKHQNRIRKFKSNVEIIHHDKKNNGKNPDGKNPNTKTNLSLPKDYKVTNSIALSEKERWQLNRFFRNL